MRNSAKSAEKGIRTICLPFVRLRKGTQSGGSRECLFTGEKNRIFQGMRLILRRGRGDERDAMMTDAQVWRDTSKVRGR
jgi:hypothetical protein